MTTITVDDLAAVLREQHDQITRLLDDVRISADGRRSEVFAVLRSYLAAHEATEAEFLHPAVEAIELARGGDSAARRLTEEHHLAQTVRTLEELGVAHIDFDASFEDLSVDLTRHARTEERVELPTLAGKTSTEHLAAIHVALTGVPALAAVLDASAPYATQVSSAEQILRRAERSDSHSA